LVLINASFCRFKYRTVGYEQQQTTLDL